MFALYAAGLLRWCFTHALTCHTVALFCVQSLAKSSSLLTELEADLADSSAKARSPPQSNGAGKLKVVVSLACAVELVDARTACQRQLHKKVVKLTTALSVSLVVHCGFCTAQGSLPPPSGSATGAAVSPDGASGIARAPSSGRGVGASLPPQRAGAGVCTIPR